METLHRAEQKLLRGLNEFREHQGQVSTELNDLAGGHTERSNELTLLEPNADIYPAQRFDRAFINGNPVKPDEIAGIATIIEKRFPFLLEQLDEAETDQRELSRIAEDLRAGENIILVTNHSDIKDIAFTLAAFYNRLKQLRMPGGAEYQFETGLIMSKMIAHLGIDLSESGLPEEMLQAVCKDLDVRLINGHEAVATDLLKLVCGREYFSFPRTDSIRNSKIAENYVKAYNGVLKRVISRSFHKGGNLFAMAPSGTTDKPVEGKPSLIRMATAGHGTMQLMIEKHCKIVPVAVWLRGGTPVFKICDIPRPVTNDNEIHTLMEAIADQLTEMVPGKQFTYERLLLGTNLGRTALQD